MSYRIEVADGPQAGESYPVNGVRGTIIGRNPANNVYLYDRSVSRAHCQVRIAQDDGRIFIEDLGSTNGTRVNGDRITERELKTGDTIQIGVYKIHVVRYDDNGSMKSTTMLQDQDPEK